MPSPNAGTYDPGSFIAIDYHSRTQAFTSGTDSPRDYLERCLATIGERDPTVQAYVTLNVDTARDAADASAKRWKSGQPLSPIDGMPVSIKDLLETREMPTQMGCEAFVGNFPKRDNAAVWALRQAGAVILGKTVTAEIGGSHPGPTTNPFDPTRTPGGSSSGSAAAVAARMVPAAIGSQVGGSIIRPAGFCGNVALKPTQGAINRGERQSTSMSTHGVHAGCVEDMWRVSIEIASRVGGDRGCAALAGPQSAPQAVRPERLVILETAGWDGLDDASKAAFGAFLEQIEANGITIIRRGEHRLVNDLENALAQAADVCTAITGWENRWGTRNLVDGNPDGVSDRAKAVLARAEAMSVDDYAHQLAARDHAQVVHTSLAGAADAMLTLSCPGPAPFWAGDKPGEPLIGRPTGDAVFNYPTSMLYAPCVSMPLLSVDRMPVGVQIIGQQHEDARMASMARWLIDNISPIRG
jgi:Asp-tRNA(Asn)/Glu-tRNA(Gln) amidotransferase A subunit family amidase